MITEQIALISLYCTPSTDSFFTTETDSVYCAVRAETGTNQVKFRLQSVNIYFSIATPSMPRELWFSYMTLWLRVYRIFLNSFYLHRTSLVRAGQQITRWKPPRRTPHRVPFHDKTTAAFTKERRQNAYDIDLELEPNMIRTKKWNGICEWADERRQMWPPEVCIHHEFHEKSSSRLAQMQQTFINTNVTDTGFRQI
jgi:hypothetical protein